MSRDVLIDELFRKIPPAGAVWPAPDRYRWLRATESVLDLLYGDNRVIEIGPLPEREPETKVEPTEQPGKTEKKTVNVIVPASTVIDAKSGEDITGQPHVNMLANRPSKGRPANIPTNLNMALDAIDELGGAAAAPQILAWCRKRYWAEMPGTWTSTLWNFAAEGKLARDGINFTRPKVKSTPAPALPTPKPAAPAPAPVVRSPAPTVEDGGMPFEHKGRKVMLHKKEWRLATALVRAMGKGHLDYRFMVDAACAGEKRPVAGDKVWLAEMFLVLTPKLEDIGLSVTHTPNFGYSMREAQPANG